MSGNKSQQGTTLVAAAIDAAEEVKVPVQGVNEPAIQSAEVRRGRGAAQADHLVGLADAAELFHAPDGSGFADLMVRGHRETWPIRSRGFRRWLSRRYYEVTGGAPSGEAFQSALAVIEAKAQYDGTEAKVHVRVAGLAGRLYLDLCDESWRAVEIDAEGWRVLDRPPVRFRRPNGMLALPEPAAGGSITSLRSFLNLRTDTDFVLVISWILAGLRDRGPYPLMVVSGEQGSAKSTFCAILRYLLDPNAAPLRALPREDRDLFIAANNSHVLAFDNVSGLPHWVSDTLCRLATGGGFAARQLHSDTDEVLFDAARPVVVNGIEDMVTRPDLADRSIFLTLQAIRDEDRRPESELWESLHTERPKILGALLDAVAEGLRRSPVRLTKLPRMADFAMWATACETSFWPAGTFALAYSTNRDDVVDAVVDADPLTAAVRSFATKHPDWVGTATDLLHELSKLVDDALRRSKAWPSDARALSNRLRRQATFLRKVGIECVFGKAEGRRTVRFAVVEPTVAEIGGDFASAASAASTGHRETDDSSLASPSTVPNCTPNLLDADAADAEDAKNRTNSADARPPLRGEAANVEFLERAGIAEYDGGLARDEAERIAAAALSAARS